MPDYEEVEYPTLTHSFLGLPLVEESEGLSQFDAIVVSIWQTAPSPSAQTCGGLAHSVRLVSERYLSYLPEENLAIYHRIRAADIGNISIAEPAPPPAQTSLEEVVQSGAAPIVIDCSADGTEQLVIKAFSNVQDGVTLLAISRDVQETRTLSSSVHNAVVMVGADILAGQYHQDRIPRFTGLKADELLDLLRLLAGAGARGLYFTGFLDSDVAAHLITQAIIYWLAGIAMRKQEV